jgi:ABC-type glycerol-3-phosphate transport system substrate-binding protein
MGMRRRGVGVVLLAVAVVLAVWAGPGWAGGPKGKVVIWYDSGAAWNSFIADFNKDLTAKYPDITVEWVTQDTAQLSAKLVAAFAAKQGPDIAMGSQYRLVGAEQQFKAWADLAGRLASDSEMKEIAAGLPKVHVDSYYSGKKLWGLPQVVQAVGLFVRKSWLDEAKGKLPEDWDELTALAEKFTKKDQFGYCIFGAPGVTNSSGIQFEYSGAAAGMLYPIVDPDGKPSFNTPIGRDVAKAFHRWQHEKKVTPPATPTFTHKEFYEVVQAGKCGIGRVGAWNVGPWSKTAIGEDYAVIPYPPMKKGQKGYQVSWSNAIAMNGASKTEEATYAVLKALMGKQGQTIFFQKLTSAARTDLDWAKLATTPQLQYFTKPQEYALEWASLDTFLPTLDILSKHLNGMLADAKTDPVKALEAADKEAQAKYTEIRKK